METDGDRDRDRDRLIRRPAETHGDQWRIDRRMRFMESIDGRGSRNQLTNGVQRTDIRTRSKELIDGWDSRIDKR